MSKRQLESVKRLPLGERRLMSPRAKRDMWAFIGFTAPNFILLGIFVFWPIVYSLFLSFFKWNMIAPKKTFIGFQNYQTMFTDPVFWQVTKNTLILAFFTVVVKLAIALGLALAMNKNVRGRSVYRAIIFSPTFTTSVAIAMVWSWIFEPTFGLLRVFMKPFGISLEIYDAALVDGVSPWQNFWYITFPLLSPTTFFLTITGFIGALKAFDIVAIMTDGGPLNSSNVIVHFLYQNAFQWFKTGYASALALILFIIIMAITLVQNRLSSRWVHY